MCESGVVKGGSRWFKGLYIDLAHQVRTSLCKITSLRSSTLVRLRPEKERRKWTRLPLAIPVFVRSRDDKGKEFLRIRHSVECQRGGSAGSCATVLAKGGPGVARDPQCAPGSDHWPSQGGPDPACADRTRQPLRGIPSTRLEVLPPPPQRHSEGRISKRETWFCSVKIFSYSFVPFS